MPTIDEARPSAENLQQRLEFETLVLDLSSRFINLRPDEVDHEIEAALRRLCEPLGIDLAVLWQWSDLGPGVAVVTHVFAPEDLPTPGPLRQEQFPWLAAETQAGRIIAMSSMAAFPAAADIDREGARLIGIKSALNIPLAVGGEPSIGVQGVASACRPTWRHTWTSRSVRRLRGYAAAG
jgi:hypothetical protein